MKKFLKENYKKILFLICIVLFLFITEDVFTKELIQMDIIGYNIMNSINNDTLTKLVKVVTNLGNAYTLITLSIILVIPLDKKKSLAIVCNLIIITLINQAFKHVFQRPRPSYRLIEESGYSFPSGHSMVSMAFYGLLIYLAFKYVKNKHLKYGLITLLSIIIISIGLSRIYLGVHYTSDVLGGFLFSISYLLIYIRIINKYYDI